MKIKVYLFFCLSILGCSKELDYNVPDFEPKLVVNGFLIPGNPISINVRKTISILSEENSVIENAEVLLFENNIFLEKLKHFGEGNYKSEMYYPLQGNSYSIQVNVDGFSSVSACDTVPEIVPILYAKRTIGNTYDEYGDPQDDYTVLFRDKPGKNYFEMFFIGQGFPNEYDSMYSVGFPSEIVIADPVMIDESELDVYPITYIFSDKLFNGQEYELNVKFGSGGSIGIFSFPFAPEQGAFVLLRSTSEAYFNYRKYWLRHSYGKQIGNKVEFAILAPLIGDPVPMYSNIKGGYGVFAAYNQSYYKLKKSDK